MSCKSLRNTKGTDAPFKLILFVVAVGVIASSMYVNQIISSDADTMLEFYDQENSLDLITEAVINTPSCLLHTETKTIGGETVLRTTRNMIDWAKKDTVTELCVTKGPYMWEATVEDLDDSTDSPFTIGDTCSKQSKIKDSVILIKRDNEIHKGKITIYLDSRDFNIAVEQTGDKYEVVIFNSGTCTTKYVFTALLSYKDTGVGIESYTSQMEIGAGKTKKYNVGSEFATELNPPSDYAIDVNAYPVHSDTYMIGLSYYQKTAYLELE